MSLLAPSLFLRRAVAALGLVAALVYANAAATAQPSRSRRVDTKSAADRSLELARRAAADYKAGRYEEAIALYEEAQRASPDPINLHNIGRCHEAIGSRRLGDIAPEKASRTALHEVVTSLRAAIEAYRAYVAEESDAGARGSAEQRIRALESQVGLIDDLANRPDPPPPAPPPGPTPARIAAPWIVAGLGGATLTAGLVVGGVAWVRDADSNAPTTSGRDTIAAADDAERLALAANVLFGVGGAISLTGLVWGIVDAASGGGATPTQAGVDVRVAPGGIVVTGAF